MWWYLVVFQLLYVLQFELCEIFVTTRTNKTKQKTTTLHKISHLIRIALIS